MLKLVKSAAAIAAMNAGAAMSLEKIELNITYSMNEVSVRAGGVISAPSMV